MIILELLQRRLKDIRELTEATADSDAMDHRLPESGLILKVHAKL